MVCTVKILKVSLTALYQLTCVFLYSINCERPKNVAAAPPPMSTVCFSAFLNAIGPADRVECGEKTEPRHLDYPGSRPLT